MSASTIATSLLSNHRRLFIAIGLGVLGGVLGSVFGHNHMNGIERPLLGWNIGLWSYLLMLWWMMMRIDVTQIRKMADREDESAGLVLASVSLAVVFSIAAIILELATVKGASGEAQKSMHILFSGLTLLGGWFLLPTLFTIHYARLFFSQISQSPEGATRVLRFPDESVDPDYWDFAYFSFTIAVASQTSDVMVAGTYLRRVALAQSVLSFFFNLAVLGLSINIAASLLS